MNKPNTVMRQDSAYVSLRLVLLKKNIYPKNSELEKIKIRFLKKFEELLDEYNYEKQKIKITNMGDSQEKLINLAMTFSGLIQAECMKLDKDTEIMLLEKKLKGHLKK